MPKQAYIKMKEITMVFECLSDHTNLRILNLLAISGQELCVCELVDSLLERQYNISKHLSQLAQAGLLKLRKEGKWAYYGMRKNRFLIKMWRVVSLQTKGKVFTEDFKRLGERLKLRQNGKCLMGIQNKNL